jgi:hypothetical protein
MPGVGRVCTRQQDLRCRIGLSLRFPRLESEKERGDLSVIGALRGAGAREEFGQAGY